MSSVGFAKQSKNGLASLYGSTFQALLFGIRLATAVSLALFVSFYLQLDMPYWAGTSAAIVCEPIVGSSLLKGLFRMIGTAVGAVAAVVLTAMFPQDRVGFLFGMLVWASFWSFASTLLRNFAAYAAMLAGYTLVIIASTSIAAPNQVFEIAIGRASEICIGIVCGTLVIALTDLGNSPQRLSALLSQLISETAGHLTSVLAEAGTGDFDGSKIRRDLIRRTAGTRCNHRSGRRRIARIASETIHSSWGHERIVRCAVGRADHGYASEQLAGG